MSLRRKVVIILSILLAVLVLVMVLSARTIVFEGYNHIEEQSIENELLRIRNIIETDASAMETSAFDYSRWDDTYNFVETRDPAFIEDNFYSLTYEDFMLDSVIILNTEREVLFAAFYEDESLVDVPQGLLDLVINTERLAIRTDETDLIYGFIQWGDMPVMAASTPILTDEGEGPVRGAIIWLRLMDADEIQRLSEVSRMTLSLNTFNASNLPQEWQTAREELSTDTTQWIHPIDSQTITGFIRLNTFDESPIALLRVELPRDIYQQGQNSLKWLIITSVSIAVITFMAVNLLFERLVIHPISDLSVAVREIGEGGTNITIPAQDHNDEIGQLARTMQSTFTMLSQTQDHLKLSEERLKTVVSSAPIILLSLDQAGTFTLMEGRGLNDIHAKPGEHVGKTVFDVYSDKPILLNDIRRALNGESFNDLVDFSDDVTLEVWYSPVTDHGKVEGVICVATNTTERKQTEDALRAAKEAAESASQSKSTFLANMSHELRTPLNAIIGFIGIMLMGNTLVEKDRNRAERIRVNGERLLSLIDDILDLSRIEAGRVTLVPEEVHLREEIRRLEKRYLEDAKEKNVELNVTISDDVPDIIRIDRDAFPKIIDNLLSNAVKFTREGNVEMFVMRSGGNMNIIVSDTGVGIPPHMHQVIFESFRQIDDSSTREFGGMGLGLAIVHHLCKAMGGTIQLESAVNQGTTFTITLPVL